MRVGIIGAMKEEIEYFLKQGTSFTEEKKAHLTLYKGSWHEHEVVITRCGVGKVNAAVTTQILIDLYNVEAILFTGVAGALAPSLEVGDLVVSTACIEHDLDASPLGFKRGEVPMFNGPSTFPADEKLVSLSYEAAKDLNVSAVMKGIVLSGDQFIADWDQVNELREMFEGACVEMEGAAVGHAAMVNNVPFVILRSISDKANGEAAGSFTTFVEESAERSAKIVEQMLSRM
ncbi:5'-methylthioadenosine/adenosylhomocysteine nucleosidase [Alteribacter keqinensis]|uniref:adenosylhomocysteine nucleosidase n=1 Tax=Alteribacter keqinensis TaxID=2483800 RepID=A0A3M7TYY3_9BACI|nr:5'-methylthioadenosine/adenosylhomocysteine nucleosidase [Alteribacter keqinensis]RNA70663.1 5'-methylthioadenosine/adenosylhomocysteine nucleosidase [Alteribacter keqinensis]